MPEVLIIPPGRVEAELAAATPTSIKRRLRRAVAAATGLIAGSAAFSSGEHEGSFRSFTPGSRQDLDRRRTVLVEFSKELAAERAVYAGSASATTRRLAVSDHSRRYEPLAALGVLVASEDAIDRDRIAELGARVVDDRLVPLIAPVAEFPTTRSQSFRLRSRLNVDDAWHLSKININAARAAKLTGKGVLIGVLDTGIDVTHCELENALFDSKAFAEFAPNRKLISREPRDAGSHGTHVAGLMVGRTIGVAPGAKLAVAAVLTTRAADGRMYGTLVQITRGLNWLLTTSFRGSSARPGVDLVNASLGVTPYADYLYRDASRLRDVQGALTIAAIGNNGLSGKNYHLSPANYDIAVGVGAVDEEDAVAPFSDWGIVRQHRSMPKPDLCAPGVGLWSCVPGGKYERFSGTSLATPLVTAAAALVLERSPELFGDAAALQSAILQLVSPISGATREKAGKGRLDLTGILSQA